MAGLDNGPSRHWRVWDAETGEVVLPDDISEGNSWDFSPDGNRWPS